MMRSLLIVIGMVTIQLDSARLVSAEQLLTRSEVILRGTGPGGTMHGGVDPGLGSTFSFGIYPYNFVWQVGPVGDDDIGSTFELTSANTADYLQAFWAEMTGFLTDGSGLEGPELGDYVTYGIGGVTGGASEVVFEKQFFYDNSIYTDPVNPRVSTELFFAPGSAPDLYGFSPTRMTMRVDSLEYVDSGGVTWQKGGFTLSIFGESVPEPSTVWMMLSIGGLAAGRRRFA